MLRKLPAAILSALLGWNASLFASSATEAVDDTGRVDVPIRQFVLPNQNIRYSVPVTVGDGPPVDAALDTGSFGLRVLGTAVQPDQYRATEVRRQRPFDAGVRFNGFIATARIGVGPLRSSREIRIQIVDKVDCIEAKPRCPASKMKPGEYRMAGDGFPGQGFRAILGISMRQARAGDAAENPLPAIGGTSWIVILPRPGSAAPGHLILNPSGDDRNGFTTIKLQSQASGDGPPGWADGALAGCISEETSQQRYCGKTLLDTGGPGLSVDSATADASSRWKPGTGARLELQGGERPIEIRFTTGVQPADRVTVHPPRNPEVLRISAGTLPYFYYSVLYDTKAGSIGFKPRDGEP